MLASVPEKDTQLLDPLRELGCDTTHNNIDTVENCDVIVLGRVSEYEILNLNNIIIGKIEIYGLVSKLFQDLHLLNFQTISIKLFN